MSTLKDLQSKNFRRWRGQDGHAPIERQPAHPGHDHQSHAHAQGRADGFRGVRRDILQSITEKPISFEVFSDEFPEMRRQALKINGWAKNVYVKIPITNTRGESSLPLVRELAREGVKLNVTAIFTQEQVAGRRPGAQSQGARRRVRVCRTHRRHGR